MRGRVLSLLLGLCLLVSPAGAQQPPCRFVLGFATLRDLVGGDTVGECVEDEYFNLDNGNAEQHTTKGLLVWRKVDNFTAFTDGATSWINGPDGVQSRPNGERFAWEKDPITPPAAAPQPAGPPPAAPIGQACGTERWAVKTLSDPAAASVDFTPRSASVDELRGLPKPNVGASTARITGTETTTFTVDATLVRSRFEDDRDIHVVIADPSDASHTMIAELPDVGCSGAAMSTKLSEMAAAREALIAACGQSITAGVHPLSGSAKITGVGFFDLIHGQDGIAPNGIELHPVVRLDDISCVVGGGAPPAPSGPTPGSRQPPQPTATPAPQVQATPTATPAPTALPTARCKDGTLSYSEHRQGTCSGHGGVSEWLNPPPR